MNENSSYTKEEAILKARKLAKRYDTEMYIVFENGFHVCTEMETNGFFFGSPIKEIVGPDGTLGTQYGNA